MRLKKISLEQFIRYAAETKKKVVIYGAGAIGQAVIPSLLCEHHLETRATFYVDADRHKQGRQILIGNRQILIKSPEALKEIGSPIILLIASSYFESILEYCERLPSLAESECCIFPLMMLEIAHQKKEKGSGVIRTSETQLIPRKLHYCWFSRKPIPDELMRCMDSWRRLCPDYEIIRWDEGNYDIHKNKYVEQAYAHEKWGFVSDFARLDAIYQYGGIFLDTDVELLRNLDELLYQPAFCGIEKWGNVNLGGCFGAQPENPVIKALLDFRKNKLFVNEDGSLNLTNSYYEMEPLIELGLKITGETQVVAGAMTVYASDFFHPFDEISGVMNITSNTFSIHYFNRSWLEKSKMAEIAQTRENYKAFLERMGKNYEKD